MDYAQEAMSKPSEKPKKSMAEKKHPAPKHGIKHTHIEHHNDGTHSIDHTYQDGSTSTHGAADVAALQQHLGEMLQPEPQGGSPLVQSGGAQGA